MDWRADIWALGVVLYGMLTGRRLFDGEDTSDVLVAVLSKSIDFSLQVLTIARDGRFLVQTAPAPQRRRVSVVLDWHMNCSGGLVVMPRIGDAAHIDRMSG